jgi:hypothetical protein
MRNTGKLIPIASGVVFAAALAIIGTSVASAAGSDSQGTASGLASAAAASCASLWAVVDSDGSLARAGCPGVTSSETSPGSGEYNVLFPRNVASCAYVANVGNAGSGLLPNSGFTSVAPSTSPDGVFVVTHDFTGVPTSENFHLVVTCSPGRSSGTVKISSPATTAIVKVPGLSSLSVVVATAQNNVGVSVISAVPDPAAGKFVIHLSKAPAPGRPAVIGWVVVS